MSLNTKNIVVVSVTTRNYIYRARVFFDSVAAFLPEAQRIVCCVDEVGRDLDFSKDSFEIVDAASLGILRYEQLALALTPTALCCLLKPYAVQFALQDSAISKVIYIDNDMALFRDPTEILSGLEAASCVLTPHHLYPLPTASIPDEQELHSFGIFNAGIFGFRRCDESMCFLKWWAEWMLDPRRFHFQSGYDQVWLNYVPVYCPSYAVLRDPTYNVAFWNLAERDLHLEKDGFCCGTRKLTTFHFSNFNENHPESLVWPRSVSNYTPSEATEKIATDIVSKWEKAGMMESLATGYGYSKWPDGREVTQDQRQVAYTLWDELPRDMDPWSSDLQSKYPDIYHKIFGITQLPSLKKENFFAAAFRFVLELSLRKIGRGMKRFIKPLKESSPAE